MINATNFNENDSTTMLADVLPKESSNLLAPKTGMHFNSMIFFFQDLCSSHMHIIFINLVACILCMLKSQIKLYFLRIYKKIYKRSNENIRGNESQDVIQDNEITSTEVSSCSKWLNIFKCKKNKKDTSIENPNYSDNEETSVKEVLEYTEDELFHNAVSKAYKENKANKGTVNTK